LVGGLVVKKVSHKLIFCIFIAVMVIGAIAASAMANAERQRHAANYANYKRANALLEEDEKLDEALKIYDDLAAVYPSSYILEYKAAVCEYYLSNPEAAKMRMLNALELYPMLVEDIDFLTILEDCYLQLDDSANADVAAARIAKL
jgi:tetratricopeptide (TPR) repeat protein